MGETQFIATPSPWPEASGAPLAMHRRWKHMGSGDDSIFAFPNGVKRE